MKEQEVSKTHQDAPGALDAGGAYLELRRALKASGGACQAHYIALKQLYEGGDQSSLVAIHQKIGDTGGMFFELENATGIDFDQLGKREQADLNEQPGSYGPSF